MHKILVQVKGCSGSAFSESTINYIKKNHSVYNTIIDLVTYNNAFSENTNERTFNTQACFTDIHSKIRSHNCSLAEFLYLTKYMLENQQTFSDLGIEEYLKNYQHILIASDIAENNYNYSSYFNLCLNYRGISHIAAYDIDRHYPILTGKSTLHEIDEFREFLKKAIRNSPFQTELKQALVECVNLATLGLYINLLKKSKIYLEGVRLRQLQINYDEITSSIDVLNHIYDTFFLKNMEVNEQIEDIINIISDQLEDGKNFRNFSDVKKVWEDIGNPIPTSKHIKSVEMLKPDHLSNLAINRALQNLFISNNNKKSYGLFMLPMATLSGKEMSEDSDIVKDGINILEINRLPQTQKPRFPNFNLTAFIKENQYRSEHSVCHYIPDRDLNSLYNNYDMIDIVSDKPYISLMYAKALKEFGIEHTRILIDQTLSGVNKETIEELKEFKLVGNLSKIQYSNKVLTS